MSTDVGILQLGALFPESPEVEFRTSDLCISSLQAARAHSLKPKICESLDPQHLSRNCRTDPWHLCWWVFCRVPSCWAPSVLPDTSHLAVAFLASAGCALSLPLRSSEAILCFVGSSPLECIEAIWTHQGRHEATGYHRLPAWVRQRLNVQRTNACYMLQPVMRYRREANMCLTSRYSLGRTGMFMASICNRTYKQNHLLYIMVWSVPPVRLVDRF